MLLDPRIPDFYINQGDTARRLEIELFDQHGAQVGLAGVTSITMLRALGEAATEEFPCTRLGDRVIKVWTPSEVDTPGLYKIQIVLNWNGAKDTYPQAVYPYFKLKICPIL